MERSTGSRKSPGRRRGLTAAAALWLIAALLFAKTAMAGDGVRASDAVAANTSPLYLPFVSAVQPDAAAHQTPSGPPLPSDSSNITDAVLVYDGQTLDGVVRPEDTDDVFRINLTTGMTLHLALRGEDRDADLYLYPPETTDVDGIDRNQFVAASNGLASNEVIDYVVSRTGTWYIDVYAFLGEVHYQLQVDVTPAASEAAAR